MSETYDVIVIGAGLGGLSAAASLAKNGLNTLLLERHNVPGGYATSFVRRRYEFEVALHELSSIGKPGARGSLYRYLESLGIAEKVEFINIPTMYRSIFPGLDITLPVGREGYEATLCEKFPHAALGIKRFLDRIFALSRELSRIQDAMANSNPAKAILEAPNLVRYLHTDLETVLRRDVTDRRARAVLTQYWGYIGLPPSKASYIYFAVMLASYMKYGAAFIKGRSQALSNAFIEVFEKMGGTVRFGCGASKITIHNGRVTGVIADDDTEYRAKWVLSNTSPLTTANELIGADKISKRFFDNLRIRKISPSSFNVYLGIARSPRELGITDHELFINSDWDHEIAYKRAMTLETQRHFSVTCYNMVDPEISPPGTTMLTLTSLYYGKPWLRLKPDEYLKTRNRIADEMITAAERYLPGLRKYAEVVEVATPITNIRYTGNIGGSIYGFNHYPYDNVAWRLDQRGPLEGLYFVGAWTMGGGYDPAMMSGAMAASDIVRKHKKGERGE